jgi:hypothetical protein
MGPAASSAGVSGPATAAAFDLGPGGHFTGRKPAAITPANRPGAMPERRRPVPVPAQA